MEPTLIAAFLVAALVISVVPGQDMMFIAANAVAAGRRGGLVAAVGVSGGLVVHTLAAAFGLGALLAAAPGVLDGIRIAGAVFLAYLAVTTLWGSLRGSTRDSDPPSEGREASPRRPLRKVFVMAMLTNMANPKVVLFYLAFFPQFLTTGSGSWPVAAQILMLGLLLMVVGLAVDASVGALVGSASTVLLRHQGFRRWMDRLAAAVFGGLALRLAWESAR